MAPLIVRLHVESVCMAVWTVEREAQETDLQEQESVAAMAQRSFYGSYFSF